LLLFIVKVNKTLLNNYVIKSTPSISGSIQDKRKWLSEENPHLKKDTETGCSKSTEA